MKIIHNIQHVILRVMLLGSTLSLLVSCAFLSSRRNLVENQLILSKIAANKIIDSLLHKTYKEKKGNKFLKFLDRKYKAKEIKYPLYALVKYFKEIQGYIDSLPWTLPFKRKIIPSFIAYHNRDINALKPIGNCHIAPLHYATKKGKLELMHFFLENGADVNLQDRNGCTALHTAAWSLNLEAIMLLLKRGANPKIQTRWGHYPADIPYSYFSEFDQIVDIIQNLLASRLPE